MKLYTVEDVKDNISRKNTVKDILQIANTLDIGDPNENKNILEQFYR